MRVCVVVAGIYNGPGHRALPWAETGAVIEVADGRYAELLIREGLVRVDEADGHGLTSTNTDAVGPDENQASQGAQEQPGRARTSRRKG